MVMFSPGTEYSCYLVYKVYKKVYTRAQGYRPGNDLKMAYKHFGTTTENLNDTPV